MDQNPKTTQFLNEKQQENLQIEKQRFDHTEMNPEFSKEARLRRKRLRQFDGDGTDQMNKIQRIANQKDEIEADNDFKTDLVEAMENYAEEKRREDEADGGVAIEPFSLREEVRGGIMTKDGVYKLKRERDEEWDMREDDEKYEEEDAWLKTIKQVPVKAIHDEKSDGNSDQVESEQENVPENKDLKFKLLKLLLHFMENQAKLFKNLDPDDFKEKINVSQIINKMKPKQQNQGNKF